MWDGIFNKVAGTILIICGVLTVALAVTSVVSLVVALAN